MPANFDREFSLWLTQHGEPRATAVNVLEFQHPRFVPPIFVCDYGEPFAAATEGGTPFTAEPLGLHIDVAADNITTEQRVLIQLDNANGAVMRQLRALTPDDLQSEVVVIYRAYLDSKRSRPAVDPVTLYLTGMQGTRLAVEIEASADALPNVTAGFRYTVDRFPTLELL